MTLLPGAWGAALDDFEDVLARQRAAFDVGRPQDAPAFAPPPGLGPLPFQLRARAEELLAASRELEAEATTARAAAGVELARARTAAEAARQAPRRPAFLDQRV
jgi:hypothetical protein